MVISVRVGPEREGQYRAYAQEHGMFLFEDNAYSQAQAEEWAVVAV